MATQHNPYHIYDLIVIGGGTAGLAAVQEGLIQGATSIALVEKGEFGGDCAHYACVPSKTMLTAAKQWHFLQHQAAQYGINAEQATFDWKVLMEKKHQIVHDGGYDFLDDSRISVFRDHASFMTSNRVQVDHDTLQGNKIIIATGSKPWKPDIPGLDSLASDRVLNFRDASQLKALPQSILIIGGGAVGVEYAYIFAALGVKVSLLEHNERILPNEEPEISAAVQQKLAELRVSTWTHVQDTEFEQMGEHVEVTFRQSNGSDLHNILICEQIMVATGTRPDLQSLDLERGGIEYDEKGIVVNDQLQTTNPSVYAIGDVIDCYHFTHVADHQAEYAVRNALVSQHNKSPDYRSIAWAIYIDPSVAHVGMTEENARQHYGDEAILTLTANAEDVSRYRIESEKRGFIKLIVHRDSQVLVGGHVFAHEGEEMAQTLVMAIDQRLSIPQLLDMMYIYPTRSQLIQKALETYANEDTQASARQTHPSSEHSSRSGPNTVAPVGPKQALSTLKKQ